MKTLEPDAPVEGVLVERVVLVDQIVRKQRRLCQTSGSLPGHLLQLTVSGRAHHELGGRVFEVEPGLVVWFHQDEEVRVRVTEAPWSFFTVNFLGPHFPAPPFDSRIRRASADTRQLFRSLLETWRDRSAPTLLRHIRVTARLLDLLADVLPSESAPLSADPTARVWWGLEAQLRQRLHERFDLGGICRQSGISARALYRACHRATGLAPMKRIKKIRLSMARGLVLYSSLRISEVADRVGYERVQELDRDYQRHFGCTPLEDRAAGPDYRRSRPNRGVSP